MGFDDLSEEEVKEFHKWAEEHDATSESPPGRMWYWRRRILLFPKRLKQRVKGLVR